MIDYRVGDVRDVMATTPDGSIDLTAVRGGPSPNTHARTANGVDSRDRSGKSADRDGNWSTMPELATTAGAPPLDCWTDHETWTITTQPSRLAHYAMWPPKLAERLILSMCPAAVCGFCGEPRRRIEGAAEYVSTNGGRVVNQWAHERVGEGVITWNVEGGNPGHAVRLAPTLGWTDCGHGSDGYVWCPGVVLDPFAGTGTTLAVAELHGRDSIGIDLDPRNRDLLEPRMAECRKALFGTEPELPGQLDMFAADGAA